MIYVFHRQIEEKVNSTEMTSLESSYKFPRGTLKTIGTNGCAWHYRIDSKCRDFMRTALGNRCFDCIYILVSFESSLFVTHFSTTQKMSYLKRNLSLVSRYIRTGHSWALRADAVKQAPVIVRIAHHSPSCRSLSLERHFLRVLCVHGHIVWLHFALCSHSSRNLSSILYTCRVWRFQFKSENVSKRVCWIHFFKFGFNRKR